MGIIRQIVRESLTACLPASRWLVRGSPRLAKSPALSLTFDDGPHPEHTPRLLETLSRWNIVGTFFVVGRDAERYPQLVTRIVEEGHALGNHTWTHSEPAKTSSAQFLEEVDQTDAWLSYRTGFRPCWMRPPKGELTWSKLRGLWRTGHTVALWNIDPRDYRMTSASDASAWCADYKPQTGDIVLLHDHLPWAAEIVNDLGTLGVFEKFRTVRLDAWLPAQGKWRPTVSRLPIPTANPTPAAR